MNINQFWILNRKPIGYKLSQLIDMVIDNIFK